MKIINPATEEKLSEVAEANEADVNKAVAPAPVIIFTTPGGSPDSWIISASLSAVRGVVSAGFNTTVLPVAIAGAIFHAAINKGKFQGMI